VADTAVAVAWLIIGTRDADEDCYYIFFEGREDSRHEEKTGVSKSPHTVCC